MTGTTNSEDTRRERRGVLIAIPTQTSIVMGSQYELYLASPHVEVLAA